jgi:P4 family phage/plasmid primase-like protien
MNATDLFELGYTDLVSVIPPGVNLSPLSKVKPDSLGKAPGRRGANGWAGYPWQQNPCTLTDAERMDRDHANIGLASARFPGVDIDCLDEGLAKIIERVSLETLGEAPQRIGRYPKRLLMYRTEEPFGRMRLWIKYKGKQHLVEILGQGQQYLIAGTHGSTGKPYEWDRPIPAPAQLVAITKDQASGFFDRLEEEIDFLGCECEREGSGALPTDSGLVDQTALRAPSMDLLAKAVALIPNDTPSYDDYVKMGIAVKAAAQADPVRGLEIFQEWAGRWENGENEPAKVAQDWVKMRSPFRIGWDWVRQCASRYGFDDSQDEFEADVSLAVEKPEADANSFAPIEYSDRAMSNRLIGEYGARIRFCDALGGWLVWDGTRWAQDGSMQVFDWAGKVLARASHEALQRVDFNAAKAERVATSLASNGARNAVVNYAKADRRVAVTAEMFDADPWLLNTPNGIVDLRTGEVRERADGELVIKRTAVTPNFNKTCPQWKKFLHEATGGNKDLERFLQIWMGYTLTGMTIEQKFAFLYGPGGNGKSVFVNTVAAIMDEYASKAAMETFTASSNDRHPTELARLRGLRMVYASETADGKRWNESRLKEITGGEPITARFMHKDEFTYTPLFSLMFLGNTRPELRSIDDGIRRRLMLIPFTVKPGNPDPFLPEKLREEWDAILAWMIEGTVIWMSEGLIVPEVVKAATDEYLEDEDAVGRWIKERCRKLEGQFTLTASLYDDWREWCGENGETAGSQKKFSGLLKARGFEKGRDRYSGRNGYLGLDLLKDSEFSVASPEKQEIPF